MDIIITKKPKSKTSSFYKEIHSLFDNINGYLKKHKGKVIRFPIEENLTLYAAKYGKNDLAFHTMVYTSYSQIERDWKWFLFDDESLKEIISKSDFLLGSFEDMLTEKFQKPSYYDPIYILLYWYDLINSNLPKEFLIKTMNHNFESLVKKRMKLGPAPIASSIGEVRKIFYSICDNVDRLARERAH